MNEAEMVSFVRTMAISLAFLGASGILIVSGKRGFRDHAQGKFAFSISLLTLLCSGYCILFPEEALSLLRSL